MLNGGHRIVLAIKLCDVRFFGYTVTRNSIKIFLISRRADNVNNLVYIGLIMHFLILSDLFGQNAVVTNLFEVHLGNIYGQNLIIFAVYHVLCVFLEVKTCSAFEVLRKSGLAHAR